MLTVMGQTVMGATDV